MPPSAVPGQATFKDPTSNRLTQFDIAVSLSQNAINNQLRNAWRIWAGVADDNDNDNDFSSFHVQAALPGGAATLDATLGAPVIDLNVASGRPDDIAVSLPLGGGTLTAAGLGTVDLPNTRLAFTASLARRSVALEQLAQIDAASAGKARAAIDGSGLPPGVFSIECLYLDLTAMSALRTLDVVPGKGAVPLSAPVTDALQQTLRTLFGTRQFLLQTVVLPRRPQRRPTFAMTQFVNKVTPYREHPDAASLDYLGVVWNGGPMPADPHHAGDALGRWLDPARVEGKAALTGGLLALRGAILTQTLADGLRDLLGHAYGDMYAANTRRKQQQPAVTNPGKELPYPEAELLKEMQISVNNGNILAQSNDRHNTYAWKDDDISYDLHKTVTLGLTPLPGTNRYQVEGRIATSMRRQRPVFLLTSEAEAFTTARIHGWLELTMPDADADRGEVKPTLQLVFDPPEQTTRNNKSFISQIGQVNTDWDQRLVSGYAGDNHAAIDRMLVDLVNQIELSLNNFAIVPPGEDALTFRLPRFSPSGDLLLDINYKGVRPQTAQ